MIITKCEKCGALMHKADRCLTCGSTSGFTKIDTTLIVHENVREEYESLIQLVQNKKFNEALDVSKVILEWMPSCSDVFWLRFLAKNNCATDEELVRNGASCEDSADYHNAVLFASEIQKQVYLNVSERIASIKEALTQQIIEHEYSEKNDTAILQIQASFPDEIEAYRKKLFQLWQELKQVEGEMLVIEKDCRLLINEHKAALEVASTEAASIKSKTYRLEQCTAEEFHKYQTRFGELLYSSEQAKSSIESMRNQHPWVETYNTLIKKRDGIVSQIDNELNSLKAYENRVQSTIAEIERIEMRHTAALISITKYKFAEIKSLIGESRFGWLLLKME